MVAAFVGAPSPTQINGGSVGNSGPRTVTVGNFIAICTSSSDHTSHVLTKILAGSILNARANDANGGDGIWTDYIENTPGGSETITLTTGGGSGAFSVLQWAEYSGLATSSTLDKTAVGTGNSTSLLSGTTAALAQADELCIGNGTISAGTNTTFTAGASYTIRVQIGNASIGTVGFLEDKVVAATTGVNASATWGGIAGAWVCTVCTFKAAAGTPADPPRDRVQIRPSQAVHRSASW